jgi:HEAT repeats
LVARVGDTVSDVGVLGLVEQLGEPDPGARQAAADALAAAGADAVAPLVAALRGGQAPVAGLSARVLMRIGDPALGPVAETLAATADPEVERLAAWAFSNLQVSGKAAYVSALAHRSPKVRARAAYVFQQMRQHAVAFAPALAALLADPDEDVCQAAVEAFAAVGPAAVPVLREARRAPGRQRRAALAAQAEAGGWDALDRRDQKLVERLIRTKIADEVPEPVRWRGSWFAVPTADQAAVLDAFVLSGARPVTMRLGISAWTHDQQHNSWHGDHARCARAYVSPVLDGWTLVFGNLPELAHAGRDAHAASLRDKAQQLDSALRDMVQQRCGELSARFGAAHWYGADCADYWTAWCLAENGGIIRYYHSDHPEDQAGPPHPAESGYLPPHENGFPPGAFDGISSTGTGAFHARYQQLKQELHIPDTAHATTVAGRASINPEALGPRTTVTGHGIIAATACRKYLPSPPGALRI